MARSAHEGWQLRLLPFMMAMLVAIAVFFSAVVLWRFVAIDDQLSHLRDIPTVAGVAALPPLEAQAIALERESLTRRYEQASLIVRARLWTRFVGFNTGMLLALVGATFVLGRLVESESKATGEVGLGGQKVSLTIASASPGLVLAFLGTILIALTLMIPGKAETLDGAIYFRPVAAMEIPHDDPATSPAGPATSRADLFKGQMPQSPSDKGGSPQ